MHLKINDQIKKQLVYLYRSGKRFTEIGDVLDCSADTVAKWLRTLGEVKTVDVSNMLTLKQIAPSLSLTVSNLYSLCKRLAIRPKVFQRGANYYTPEQVETIRKSPEYAQARKTTGNPKPKSKPAPHLTIAGMKVPKPKLPRNLGMLCRSCKYLSKENKTVLCLRTKLTIEDYSRRSSKCGCYQFESRKPKRARFQVTEGDCE